MSRSVLATAYGGPEVLSVVTGAPPEPGPGEVLVEMRAAGVNPADWKQYTGAWGHDPSRLPMRLGYEVAGVVTAVGPDADGLAVGDEIIAQPVQGAYADHVVVPASRAVPKPADLEWPEAGALLLAGATAEHTLVATGVGAGDTVLVHGASGGVGSMVVQLAKVRGARVIGTASAGNHDCVEALGATPLSYGPGLEERVRRVAPGGVTAAVDTVGTDEALDVSVAVVPDRRRVASIAGFHRPELGIKLLGHGGDPGAQVRAGARRKLVDLAAARRIKVRVGATFHLEDVARAHKAGMEGAVRGKIVVVP